eukprot:Sspe_Gene.103813::Locus_79669_Transcript_1_1_Confidence_1.000_Length_382::g.103813::m.103813
MGLFDVDVNTPSVPAIWSRDPWSSVVVDFGGCEPRFNVGQVLPDAVPVLHRNTRCTGRDVCRQWLHHPLRPSLQGRPPDHVGKGNREQQVLRDYTTYLDPSFPFST